MGYSTFPLVLSLIIFGCKPLKTSQLDAYGETKAQGKKFSVDWEGEPLELDVCSNNSKKINFRILFGPNSTGYEDTYGELFFPEDGKPQRTKYFMSCEVTEDSPSGELESPDDVPYVDRCIAIESFPPAASNTLELRYNPKEVVRYRDGKVHYIHNPKFPQKSSGPQGPIPGLGEWTELTCKSQAKPKGSKPKDSKPK